MSNNTIILEALQQAITSLGQVAQLIASESNDSIVAEQPKTETRGKQKKDKSQDKIKIETSVSVDDDAAVDILIDDDFTNKPLLSGSAAVEARRRGMLKNHFTDNLNVGNELIQNQEERKKYRPVKGRSASKKIKVKCHICGREEQIYQSELGVVEGSRVMYRCQNCYK